MEQVYFINPNKDLEKGDIKIRILKASIKIPVSERQIYKWLSKARKRDLKFLNFRGMSFSF